MDKLKSQITSLYKWISTILLLDENHLKEFAVEMRRCYTAYTTIFGKRRGITVDYYRDRIHNIWLDQDNRRSKRYHYRGNRRISTSTFLDDELGGGITGIDYYKRDYNVYKLY